MDNLSRHERAIEARAQAYRASQERGEPEALRLAHAEYMYLVALGRGLEGRTALMQAIAEHTRPAANNVYPLFERAFQSSVARRSN